MNREPAYEALVHQNNILKSVESSKKNQEAVLQQKIWELSFLNSLGNQLNASLSMDQIIQLTLDNYFNLLKPDLVLIFLREGDQLFIQGEKYNESEFQHRNTPIHQVGECLCGLAVHEKKAIYSLNINTDMRCTWNECKEAGFVSFAALPLINRNEVNGVIGLGSCMERDFSSHGTFMETIANQVARSLKNAVQYKQLNDFAINLKQEIKERKQAETRLLTSEKKYKSLVENVPGLVYRGRLDWSIEIISSLGMMIGYTMDEINAKKRKWLSIIHPDDAQRILNESLILTKSQKDVVHQYRIISKTGDIKWLEDRKTSIFSENGEFIEIYGIAVDITDRRQAKEAMKRSESILYQTFEAIPDLLSVHDRDFRILFSNWHGHEYILQEKREQKPYCYAAYMNRDKPCEPCHAKEVFKSGKPRTLEMTNPVDGIIREINIYPIFDKNGNVEMITEHIRDITEMKNMETTIQQSQKMESIGTLAGGIAHDFNNILYMISGNAELALEDIPRWNPVHTNLQEIKSASLRAAGIVRQLLDFSRKTDQKLKAIDAVTIIKDSLKFLRSSIPSTVEIRTCLPEEEIPILADPIQINQVLMNICTNASQAMEETGGIIDVKLESIRLEPRNMYEFDGLTAGRYIKLTISDTGPGINPGIISQIFDPYFTTKAIGKGSGMGLSIVHGIVKSHNGTIRVDSILGKGTSFYIFLPEAVEKIETRIKTSEEFPRGTETILFVDDEQAIADMSQQVLEKLGYQVETRLEPMKALDLFQSKPDQFDLVITDMTMPRMTGLKLFEELIKIRPDIPVIICTGHHSLIDARKAGQLGIAAYVLKPVSMSVISKTIREVLDR